MRKLYLYLLLLVLTVIGCVEEEPDLVWNPDPSIKENPIISNIEPANSVFSASEKLTITGENFSKSIDNNRITVNGVVGTILSATSNQLTALSPPIVGDSLTIRIDVIGAYGAAEYFPYQLKSPSRLYGNISNYEFVQDIEFDKDGYLYALITDASGIKKVVKISPDEQTMENYGTVNIKVGKPTMKFGPDGSLYMPRKNNKKLYRIPPGGGSTELVKAFPGKIKSLDFDAMGNLYTGGNGNEIYRYNSDGTIETVADYDTTDIIAVRVYNNYLYVVGQTDRQTEGGLIVEQNIWRNKISSSTENLGIKELVYYWSENHPNNFISEITFSEDGNMYLSTDEENPVIILSPTLTEQYLYSGILEFPAEGITWGTGEYLYYINEQTSPEYKKQIYQVFIGKNGAVYYGRQ